MKFPRLLSAVIVSALCGSVHAHGPGHVHRDTEDLVDQDVVGTSGPVTGGTRPAASASAGGKSFKTPVETETSTRWWGASLTTGWESRHVHYGVDETGPGGAYTTELSLWVQNFSFSVWNGFGTGNEFQEWDFTLSYRADLGPVFFIPGYNFRYSPGHGDDDHGGHDDHEEEHDEHEDHAGHDDHSGHDHAGHTHKTYGNELFFVLGTDRIPYVTPTMAFIWDLNNTPGALLEFRVDGEVPLYKDIVTLQPYALLAINLGYNTNDDLGWNNFQFGLEANWKITRSISVFGGVNYSVAMTALQSIDQPNVVWANAGVSFRY
jgi:hypothetical protein